jgi:hypothetical protein
MAEGTMEQVTPVDVVQKDTGWYEIALEDGRNLSTKSRQLSDVMFQKVGSEVGVEVNTVVNGKFTNHYLNKIEGVVEERSSKRGGASRGAGRASGGGGRSPEQGKQIAAQWAVGRAVELYCADHPLLSGDADLAKIAETAKQLLATRDSLL